MTPERIEEFRKEYRIPPRPNDESWVAEENAALDAICDLAKDGLRLRNSTNAIVYNDKCFVLVDKEAKP